MPKVKATAPASSPPKDSAMNPSTIQSPTATQSAVPLGASTTKPVKHLAELPNPKPNSSSPPAEGSQSDISRPVRRYHKPNYFKYQKIKNELIDLLKTGNHQVGFIAHKVHIAPNSTLFKYQSLAEKETGLLLISKEERDYLQVHLPPKEMEQLEARLQAQNKPPSKISRHSETQSEPDLPGSAQPTPQSTPKKKR